MKNFQIMASGILILLLAVKYSYGESATWFDVFFGWGLLMLTEIKESLRD